MADTSKKMVTGLTAENGLPANPRMWHFHHNQ